jgi:hypothetical protein
MTILAALILLALSPQTPPAADPARPAIEKKTVSAGALSLHYLTIPWGPQTFAAMEQGGESFYAKRTWPFARLEAKEPFSLDGVAVSPGNYALVFHPNTPDNKGMSLELRKIAVPEFLVPGNVMTRTPEGESKVTSPASFATGAELASNLVLELQPAATGTKLVVRYGDRRLIKELGLSKVSQEPPSRKPWRARRRPGATIDRNEARRARTRRKRARRALSPRARPRATRG